MNSLVFLVALFVSANAAVFIPQGRVVGGIPVNITEAPFTAAVLIDSTGSGIYNQACGGVIVSRSAVLTSAQCTVFAANRIRVRVGSTYHNSGGQVIQVASFKNHESFSAANFNNDLSILRLATNISLGSTAVTITLPVDGATLGDGSNCLHYGWGRLSAEGSTPVNLYKVTLPSINQDYCTATYSGINTVTSNMLCAGLHGLGGVGPCQGDVGGPLVYGGILYGISSWGRGCAEPNYPAVFTKIPMYRTWLNNNL